MRGRATEQVRISLPPGSQMRSSYKQVQAGAMKPGAMRTVPFFSRYAEDDRSLMCVDAHVIPSSCADGILEPTHAQDFARPPQSTPATVISATCAASRASGPWVELRRRSYLAREMFGLPIQLQPVWPRNYADARLTPLERLTAASLFAIAGMMLIAMIGIAGKVDPAGVFVMFASGGSAGFVLGLGRRWAP